MKIRNGFVSNSSSSSFLVKCHEWYPKSTVLLTKKEEELLQKFGFKKVSCSFADQVACELYHDFKPKIRKEHDNYGYDVSCNQDEVIFFLLKHNIPFEASIHYNHSNIVYVRDSKHFLELQNYGEQAAMADLGKNYKELFKEAKWWDRTPIKKVLVKRWLKQQETWIEKWEKQEKEEYEKIAKKIAKEKPNQDS